MNIADYSIRKKTVTLFIVALLVLGGIVSFNNLGMLEDPEFTIKTVTVITTYPGATPAEVEEEVTEKVESALQKLSQVKEIRSLSEEGLSIVYMDVKDEFTAGDLPQIWDEVRRKINDMQIQLPPGAGPSLVNDDYGDVYGIYFALTGEGYSAADLRDFAEYLRKQLLLVPGVAKITTNGISNEAVYIDISRARMAEMGVSMTSILSTLQNQNLVQPTGNIKVGSEYIWINPTGTFTNVEEIGELQVRSASGALLRLKDFSEIKRDYVDPPSSLMRFNGRPAVGIGISNVSGGNVIDLGDRVMARIEELKLETPVGMELGLVYYQAETVHQSIKGFLINLLEALAIVIAVLMIFMGLQSGVLMGGILLLTILATFIFMKLYTIDLQSISLGALIIALGMLVDNAIVVTDGILIRIQGGMGRTEAASDIVKGTMWPLLGATIIAVLAFAPIGLSPDSTGEFCHSLFQVIAISLLLSWVLAITVTPLLCKMFLKVKGEAKSDQELYSGKFYLLYRNFLSLAIRRRWLTVAVLVGLLVLSVFGFGFVSRSFFPSSESPQFILDYWRTEGTHISDTSEDMRHIEEFMMGLEEVMQVSTFVGDAGLRFVLTYPTVDASSSFGRLIVELHNAKEMKPVKEKTQQFLAANFPQGEFKISSFSKGTSGDAKIQVRFVGNDPAVLRQLSEKVKAIFRASGNAMNIKDDWRQRVKVIRPVIDETKARNAGLSRTDINQALETAFDGTTVGLYREQELLLPIKARLFPSEVTGVSNLANIPVWSSITGKSIPMGQMVTRLETVGQDPIVRRKDRLRTLTVECDPIKGEAGPLFDQMRPLIEAIPLPPGYTLEWGGEYESSGDAQAGLMNMIPLAFLLMVTIVVILFNALRQPLIIFLCLPLSIVGVTAGLLLLNQPFSFMALLGFLSLTGMLIKNAIVLLDQIDLEIREGKAPYLAILDSSVSRARPVAMAAMTTVLGMIPLYFDVLYAPMAVTIMFGLTFATVLTLVVVPVLYALFFKVREA